MAIDVQLWIEDLSTEEPRVTHCYATKVASMPASSEDVALPAWLVRLAGGKTRIEQDPKQDTVWLYAEVGEWSAEEHEAMLAAGYTDAGLSESYENISWLWPDADAPQPRTVPGMGLYNDIQGELNRTRDDLRELTAKIDKDAPELDDVACDDIDAGLDELDEAVLVLRRAVGGRRVVLHREQVSHPPTTA